MPGQNEIKDAVRPNVMDAIDESNMMTDEFLHGQVDDSTQAAEDMSRIEGITIDSVPVVEKAEEMLNMELPPQAAQETLEEGGGCLLIDAIVVRGAKFLDQGTVDNLTGTVRGTCAPRARLNDVIGRILNAYDRLGLVSVDIGDLSYDDTRRLLTINVVVGRIETVAFEFDVSDPIRKELTQTLQGSVARVAAIEKAVMRLREFAGPRIVADVRDGSSQGLIGLRFISREAATIPQDKDAINTREMVNRMRMDAATALKDTDGARPMQADQQCVPLNSVSVTNGTFLSQEELDELVADHLGACRPPSAAADIISAINQRYAGAGYRASRINDGNWDRQSGHLTLQAFEPRLEVRVSDAVPVQLVDTYLGSLYGAHANIDAIEKALQELSRASSLPLGFDTELDQENRVLTISLGRMESDTVADSAPDEGKAEDAPSAPSRMPQLMNRMKEAAIAAEQALMARIGGSGARACRQVGELTFTGGSVLPAEIITELRARFENKCSSLEDLNSIHARITSWYEENGYIASYINTFELDERTGILQVGITEGRIVKISKDDQLKDSLYSKYFKPLLNKPANAQQLSAAQVQLATASGEIYQADFEVVDSNNATLQLNLRYDPVASSRLIASRIRGPRRAATVKSRQSAGCMAVRDVEIVGATLMPRPAQDDITGLVAGRCLDQAGIQKVLRAIQEYYAGRGYISSGVTDARFDQGAGTFIVEVTEKKIESIRVKSFRSAWLVRSVFRDLVGKPTNVTELQRRRVSLSKSRSTLVELNIQPGSDKHSDIVEVTVKSRGKRVSGHVGIDNYASQNYRYMRPSVSLNVENVLLLNDTVSLSYDRAPLRMDFGYSDSIFAGYAINLPRTTVSLTYTMNNFRSEVNTGSNTFDVTGGSRKFGLRIARKLASLEDGRLAGWNFFASAMLEHKRNKTYFGDVPITIQTYNITTLTGGLSAFGPIPGLPKGRLSFNASATTSVPLFDVARGGVRVHGFETSFRRYNYSARMEYSVLDDVILSASVQGQYSPNRLLPATEQFSLGGRASSPGFRSSVDSGSSGILLRAGVEKGSLFRIGDFNVGGLAEFHSSRLVNRAETGWIHGAKAGLDFSYGNHLLQLQAGRILDAPDAFTHRSVELYARYLYRF